MQIAKSLCPDTVRKILRSLLWSSVSGTTACLTCYIATENLKISLLTGILAILAPFAPNAAIQYQKGETRASIDESKEVQ